MQRRLMCPATPQQLQIGWPWASHCNLELGRVAGGLPLHASSENDLSLWGEGPRGRFGPQL